MLQFGHGGDAVGDGRELHLFRALGKLQFGHGGDAVGDENPDQHLAASVRSFNSATAVTPWVTSVPSCGSRRMWCFNSATAVTPWVTLSVQRAEQYAQQYGFNSATAVTPWVTDSSSV